MQRLKVLVVILFSAAAVVVLSSCGSGGSSSGGGGDRASAALAGQYFGFENLSLASPGLVQPIGVFPINILITATGAVMITDVDGNVYHGQLGNAVNQRPANQLLAAGPFFVGPVPGLSCSPLTLQYVGTVVGNMITGSVRGNNVCSSGGVTLPFVLQGPISASRAPAAVAPPGVAAPPPVQQPVPPRTDRRRGSGKQEGVLDNMESMF